MTSMKNSLAEDDPVVSEIDVFISHSLANKLWAFIFTRYLYLIFNFGGAFCSIHYVTIAMLQSNLPKSDIDQLTRCWSWTMK